MLLLCGALAWATTVAEVPNPRDHDSWVSDAANVLTDEEERALNQQISRLHHARGIEAAVVTVREVDGRTPKAFATDLFNTWGIGSAQRNDGLLVLMVVGERRLEMEIGTGLERHISGDWLHSMQQDHMVGPLREGHYGEAFAAGLRATSQHLASTAPRVQRTNSEARSGGSLASVVVSVALGAMVLLIVLSAGKMKLVGGSGAMPTACRRCRGTLVLLEGEELMATLSPAEQVEHRLGNVLHDAYQCPTCRQVQHWHRLLRTTRHCTVCKAHTIRLDTALADARGLSDDIVQLTYTCELCGAKSIREQPTVGPGPTVLPFRAGFPNGGGGGMGGSRGFGGGRSGGGGRGSSF